MVSIRKTVSPYTEYAPRLKRCHWSNSITFASHGATTEIAISSLIEKHESLALMFWCISFLALSLGRSGPTSSGRQSYHMLCLQIDTTQRATTRKLIPEPAFAVACKKFKILKVIRERITDGLVAVLACSTPSSLS